MCENELRNPVSQYESNSLVERFIGTFTNQVCESGTDIKTLYDFFNIEIATGEWLNLIGHILGQPRVAYDGANQNWFAMDSLDPITSGFNVGKFWDGVPSDSGLIVVDDILYRDLIRARIINNRAHSTIEDILTVVELILGRTDCHVLDGGCEDSSLVTPDKMQFALEFTNAISEDERSLLLDLDLLPRTAGVQLKTVLP